jgi:hypothetical protein
MRLRGGHKLCCTSRYVSFGIGRVFSHLTLPRMQTTNARPCFPPTQPSCSSMHRGRRHSTRPSLPSQDGTEDTTVESDQNACVGSPKSATCGPNSQVSPIAATIPTPSLLLTPFHLSVLSHRQGCPLVVPDHSFPCSLMSSSCT